MKSFIILIVAGISLCTQLRAQNQMSNWFFSDSIHIHFSVDTFDVNSLSVYPSALWGSTNRNYSILSDSIGDIILYKDSYYIYDKHGYILSDTSILISSPHRGSTIILPTNNSIGTIYILNLEDDLGRINYCKVEMNDEDSTLFISDDECNVFLDEDTISHSPGRFIINRHANGRDWWVVDKIHSLTDSLQPISVRLFSDSEFGMSSYYYFDENLEPTYFQYGQIVFNESGNQFAIENDKEVRIYNFNRCTGEVTFSCLIDTLEGYYLTDLAFSQSGDYLYAATDGNDEDNLDYVSRIWQFDIASSGSCEELEESMQLVYEESEPYDYWRINSMLLERISGRIYFSVLRKWLVLGDDTITGPQNLNLHAIMEPDLPGELCDVQENVLYLDGMFVSKEGLPNMPNYALGALEGSPCDTLNDPNPIEQADGPSFKAYPNPVQDFMYIDNPLQTICQAVVYNAMGQEVERFIVQVGGQTVSTNTWPTGIYQLIIQQKNATIWKQSVVKME